MTRWLPALSVHRPVMVSMVFLALCVLGFIAWARIPLEMMPGRFELNQMWVWVPYADSTPQENQTTLARPIEEQLATIEGLKSISSSSSSGSTSFELTFHRSIGMDSAYNSVVDRMERAMVELPDDVQRYWVYRWNPADEPVLWAGIRMPEEVEDPYRLVNEVISQRLMRVPGVGKVDAWGADPKRVFIDFSLPAVQQNGLNLGEVLGKLGGDNFQLPSGRVSDRGHLRYVRSLARYEDLDVLRRTPIKPGITLQDIAEVTYRLDPSPHINRIDGSEGAAIAISKESDANTVATADAIKEAMEALNSDPRLEGAALFSFFDQGSIIRDSVDNLLMTALTGGGCAVVVLFAFLRRWRLTLLIAASIPFTLLMTVSALYFTGGSLNLLSLMGLMLAVGMVVDNAIVVVEAIQARLQEGDSPAKAAVEGASEVGMAITLSTLTTMVVFLPVILMSEDANFSFFMGELGFPVVFALAASLVVALFFTPLGTTLLKEKEAAFEPAWVSWLAERYRGWLQRVLTRRTDTLVGVVLLSLLTFMVPFKAVGCRDAAEGNINDFVVRYEIPGDFTYPERQEVVDAYERWVDDNREAWGVRVHRSRLSATSTTGRTYVYLEEEPAPDALSRDQVLKEAERTLPTLPGVTASIGWQQGAEGEKRQVNLVLTGEDTETLAALGDEVQRRIRAVPGVLGVAAGIEEDGGRELRLIVDRQATSRTGITARSIGQTVGFALRGTPLPPWTESGKEVEVYARFRAEDRYDASRLLDFPMFSPATFSVVPLRSLVSSEIAPGLGTIRRQERITSWPLVVDLDQGLDAETGRGQIMAALDDLELPRGYELNAGGGPEFEMEEDDARNMALVLSIVFVFLIMGVLFESLLLPLSIITTIPMALFGVYWTLYLTRTPLDAMGGVGLVILIGVVVNNGIVLIDLVTRLRAEGMPRTEALVEAGRRRLRPILMTALTTIFGLLPMAMGTATFVGIPYAPMGRVVAGGLVAGTLLTLFFVPYLYSVLDDMRDSGRRWWAWVGG